MRVEYASEALRQRLNDNPNFNAYDAFNSLDINEKGSITAEELRRILECRGFFVGVQQSQLLVGKMDKNRNGNISFKEFVDETRPKSPVRH